MSGERTFRCSRYARILWCLQQTALYSFPRVCRRQQRVFHTAKANTYSSIGGSLEIAIFSDITAAVTASTSQVKINKIVTSTTRHRYHVVMTTTAAIE